eukprot:COSAG01_NODE_1012_length_12139_cov_18.389950_10_plen_105_part_00
MCVDGLGNLCGAGVRERTSDFSFSVMVLCFTSCVADAYIAAALATPVVVSISSASALRFSIFGMRPSLGTLKRFAKVLSSEAKVSRSGSNLWKSHFAPSEVAQY